MTTTTVYETGSDLMDAMYHQDRVNRSGKMRRFLPPGVVRGSRLSDTNVALLAAFKKEFSK